MITIAIPGNLSTNWNIIRSLSNIWLPMTSKRELFVLFIANTMLLDRFEDCAVAEFPHHISVKILSVKRLKKMESEVSCF